MKMPVSLFFSVLKMKKPKAPRVPVLEQAFEVNLPKLMRAVKASGRREVVLVDGDEHTVAVLSETRLAVHLGGRAWLVDVVAVPCLNDRVRPLLKCPRAHEGNFQSLYWRDGELACRLCHRLRYKSKLATSSAERVFLKQFKLLGRMGGTPGATLPERQPRAWRKRYLDRLNRLAHSANSHFDRIRQFIKQTADSI
ncbi:hypothetical protein GTP23_20545 [Pseudoduganella sp. FT93W]|uniref:Uncharacterized protein n=1 Tax=Duganella fentianensis TaxID=2692177 RepID=A0A845I6Z8_9BURK|nr:hypothetical protein [Duganella fentianensis]MYN47438.1 hypothetical protein [Duganella fentianensis]